MKPIALMMKSLAAALAVLALLAVNAVAQEKVRIGLAVPNAAAFVGLYAAVDRGFFKELGVEPEITIFRGGAAAQEAMSAGATDIITYFPGGVGLVQTRGGGKSKVVSMIDARPLGWLLLTKADSKIKTIADLKGMKLGITAKGGMTDMLAIWLTGNAKIQAQIIPVGGAAINQAMLDGQVDAIVATPAGSWQMVEDGRARVLYDFGNEMNPIIADAWVASEEIMTKRPEVLRKTLAAILKGIRHMQDDSAYGLKFLKEFTQEKDDKTNQLTYDRLVKKLSRDGMMEAAWAQESLTMASNAWNNPDIGKLPPDAVFTNQFLK